MLPSEHKARHLGDLNCIHRAHLLKEQGPNSNKKPNTEVLELRWVVCFACWWFRSCEKAIPLTYAEDSTSCVCVCVWARNRQRGQKQGWVCPLYRSFSLCFVVVVVDVGKHAVVLKRVRSIWSETAPHDWSSAALGWGWGVVFGRNGPGVVSSEIPRAEFLSRWECPSKLEASERPAGGGRGVLLCALCEQACSVCCLIILNKTPGNYRHFYSK